MNVILKKVEIEVRAVCMGKDVLTSLVQAISSADGYESPRPMYVDGVPTKVSVCFDPNDPKENQKEDKKKRIPEIKTSKIWKFHVLNYNSAGGPLYDKTIEVHVDTERSLMVTIEPVIDPSRPGHKEKPATK